MPEADIMCDICGRVAAVELAGSPRLSYCPSCQRFACATCWIPTGGTCRQCLLGPEVAQGRLRPRISETFQAPAPLPLQHRRISSQPAPAPPWAETVDVARTKRASRQRLRWPGVRWRLAAAAAFVVVLGALVFMNLLPPSEPRSDDRPSTVVPAVLPVGTSPASVPATSALSSPVTYVVVAGDTLTSIAASAYGDESLWPLIYDANRDVIADPGALRVGQALVIPPR